MQVILLEKIRNLGDLGETVKVKSGYGRNFLIPQGKAVFASEENAVVFETRRSELEAKAKEKLDQAQAIADKLSKLDIFIDVLSSDEGKLYGSIGPNELSQAIADLGVEVNRREIIMPLGAIHETGLHSFDVQLHSDIVVTLTARIGQVDLQEEDTATEEAHFEQDDDHSSLEDDTVH